MLHRKNSASTDAALDYQLIFARDRGLMLLEQIVSRGLIEAGRQTKEVQKAIYDLAEELLYPPGTKPRFWHKQILRVGEDTVNPYSAKLKNDAIQPGDIAFFDLGPVLNVETDLGRTIVVSGPDVDLDKLRVRNDSERLFCEVKAYYQQNPALTGEALYEYIRLIAESNGWKLSSQPHSGHLIGTFPHEKILGDTEFDYICPANTKPLNSPDRFGNQRHWILEIHLVHSHKPFGAFYEDLLTL